MHWHWSWLATAFSTWVEERAGCLQTFIPASQLNCNAIMPTTGRYITLFLSQDA